MSVTSGGVPSNNTGNQYTTAGTSFSVGDYTVTLGQTGVTVSKTQVTGADNPGLAQNTQVSQSTNITGLLVIGIVLYFLIK
jgi:hypothetical protein